MKLSSTPVTKYITALFVFVGATPSLLDTKCEAQTLPEPNPEDVWNNAPQYIPNQVPYVSTYYIPAKVPVGQNLNIKYYVTDFFQKEFMRDDHSELFTIDYWANGNKTTLSNVAAGDNTNITLQNLPLGTTLFSIQATDSSGRKSYRMFQEFRVIDTNTTVLDPTTAIIPPNQIYFPTTNDLLGTWGIHTDGTSSTNTTTGITAMLAWASSNAYRKVVLPAGGTYLITPKFPPNMASHLILDMNGSTFKLEPSAIEPSYIMQIVNCDDSHVINGTFEGDRYGHTFNPGANGESVRGIQIGIGAEYCSFQNVTVKDVTGYGVNTSFTGIAAQGTTNYIKPYALNIIGPLGFALGDIDGSGNSIPSTIRATSTNMTDITGFKSIGNFFQFGRYLGFQGHDTGSTAYLAHFYNASTNYLETIVGHMFRRTYIPDQAKYLKVTVFGSPLADLTDPTGWSNAIIKNNGLQLFRFQHPYNSTFKDLTMDNIRVCGMVPSGFYNLLVEGCTFTNCGSHITLAAFDAEDGWDMMQELTFRNNLFTNNPNNDFVINGGYNAVVENNTNMQVVLRARANGLVLRNNTIDEGSWIWFNTRQRTGYPRMIYNTVSLTNSPSSAFTLSSMATPPDALFCFRDSTFIGGKPMIVFEGAANTYNTYFYKCDIKDSLLFSGKAVQCVFSNVINNNISPSSFLVYGSIINNSIMRAKGTDSIGYITGSVLSNSIVSSVSGADIFLENNFLFDSSLTGGSDGKIEREFTLRGNTIVTTNQNVVDLGNAFTGIVFQNNKVTFNHTNFNAIKFDAPTHSASQVFVANNTFSNTASSNSTRFVVYGMNPSSPKTLTITYSNNIVRGGIKDLSLYLTLSLANIYRYITLPRIFENPVATVQNGKLSYSFVASTNPQVFTRVETTTNLVLSNSWTTNNVTAAVPISQGDGMVLYKYEVPMSGSSQRFMRAVPAP